MIASSYFVFKPAASCQLPYFSHYDLLYNFGLQYTKDNQMIEDAIQYVFSYFLKSAGILMPVKNLRAILLQSFRHQLIFDLKIRNPFNAILGITVDSCYKLVYRTFKDLRQDVERLEKGSKHLKGIL